MKSYQTGSSKVWVLVAVLAAAIGAVLYLGGVYPPGDQSVSGTIVPAERYRANQITSDDVVLGDESESLSAQGNGNDTSSGTESDLTANSDRGNNDRGNKDRGNNDRGNADRGNKDRGNNDRGNKDRGNADRGNNDRGNN